MDAVEGDAGGEEVGSACQAEGRQVAAVGAAPEADPLRVYVGAVFEIKPGAEHIVELAAARSAVVQSFAKFHAIADAASIVDRQDDEALAGQVLVHRVGVVVVAAIVPSQEHLPPRAAVEEQQRGPLLARPEIPREEELAGDGLAVGGGERHGLRHGEVALWEVRGDGFGRERPHSALANQHRCVGGHARLGA